MSHLQEHADKLNPISNDVNRLMRLIRVLDKRVEIAQTALVPLQRQFEAKLKSVKQGKLSAQQLKADYDNIVGRQKQIYGYAKQKQNVAEQLVNVVKDQYLYIKNDLKTKIKESKPADQQQNQLPKPNKKKPRQPQNNNNKQKQQQQQYLYDPADMKYCYCNRGSFGEMVGCEHPFCQKQWFHIQCVQEKASVMGASQWFCNDCTKLKQKFKKSQIKEFL